VTKAKVLKAARALYGNAVDVYTMSEIVGRHSSPYARDAAREVTAIVRRTTPLPFIAGQRFADRCAAESAWNNGIVAVAKGATAAEAWTAVLVKLAHLTQQVSP
jgi:hypothetical protein